MVGFQQESEKVALWWKIYVCAVGFCAVGVSVNVCWIKHFISTFAAAIAIKQPFLYKHKDKNHKTGSIFTFFNHSLIEKETCYVFFHFSACSYGLNHLFSLFRFSLYFHTVHLFLAQNQYWIFIWPESSRKIQNKHVMLIFFSQDC